MDEPLSNLDAKLRMEMRTELKRLHRETDSTFVYVTHDQLEAMTLSNRVCLMKNGYMQQYAPPLEVYRRPANTFTADFVGSPPINLIGGTVLDTKPVVLLLPGDVKLAFIPADTVQLEKGQEIVLGLRPEHVEITDSDAMAEGIILSSLPSGMETIVQLSLGESYLHSVIFGDLDFDVQKKVGISFSKGNFNLFDKKTTLNLGQGKLAKA